MAFKSLPLDSSLLKYEFSSNLKGVPYRFYLRFNNRAKKWVLNIYDSENTPIAVGAFISRDVLIHKYIAKEEIKDLDLFTIKIEE